MKELISLILFYVKSLTSAMMFSSPLSSTENTVYAICARERKAQVGDCEVESVSDGPIEQIHQKLLQKIFTNS